MKIILIEKINKLGNFGEQKKVKSGYARNFLIPQNKAIVATKENIKYFDEYKTKLKKQTKKLQLSIDNKKTQIQNLQEITLTVNASIHGKLFGSISTKDIANKISDLLKFKIPKNNIILPKGSLKKIGKHNIKIKIYKNVIIKFIVNLIKK